MKPGAFFWAKTSCESAMLPIRAFHPKWTGPGAPKIQVHSPKRDQFNAALLLAADEWLGAAVAAKMPSIRSVFDAFDSFFLSVLAAR